MDLVKNLITRAATVGIIGLIALQLTTPVLGLEIREKAASKPAVLKALTARGVKVALGTGTLKSKSGDVVPATLVVTKDGKDYTVNVDANTQLRRRFWGKATLSEFSAGDTLNVIGKWANDEKTTVDAKLIRDASIQKRFGAFVGEVTSLSSTGWVMKTVQRGDQTVTVSTTTKFINRREQPITQADVKVGDKVRVKGLWDSKANTITEVTGVKDYSLPVKT